MSLFFAQGGVGIAMGIYGTTLAFVNTHMASKNTAQRRAQFSELVERLGAKLGGRGFSLNEEFHHVIWVGDLNFHIADVSAVDALTAVKQGRHMELLLHHDELLGDKVGGVQRASALTQDRTPGKGLLYVLVPAAERDFVIDLFSAKKKSYGVPIIDRSGGSVFLEEVLRMWMHHAVALVLCRRPGSAFTTTRSR